MNIENQLTVTIPVPKRSGNEKDAKLPDTITVALGDKDFGDGPKREDCNFETWPTDSILGHDQYFSALATHLYFNRNMPLDAIPEALSTTYTTTTGMTFTLGFTNGDIAFPLPMDEAIRLYAEDDMRADTYSQMVKAACEGLANALAKSCEPAEQEVKH